MFFKNRNFCLKIEIVVYKDRYCCLEVEIVAEECHALIQEAFDVALNFEISSLVSVSIFLGKETRNPAYLHNSSDVYDKNTLDRQACVKGILHQKNFYRLNLIFWLVMGCGIARFGRRGLKTSET